MAFHSSETFGKSLGLTVFAAGTDFGATTDWIPSMWSPSIRW
jgi:hypothetical protein